MWYCIKKLLKSDWIMLYFFTLSLVIVTSSKKLIKFVRHDLPLANPGWLSKQPVLAKCAPKLSLSNECRLLHKYRDYKTVLNWWREGWTLLWDCKAESGEGWGACCGRREILVMLQVWIKKCKRWSKKKKLGDASAVLQLGAEWKEKKMGGLMLQSWAVPQSAGGRWQSPRISAALQ